MQHDAHIFKADCRTANVIKTKQLQKNIEHSHCHPEILYKPEKDVDWVVWRLPNHHELAATDTFLEIWRMTQNEMIFIDVAKCVDSLKTEEKDSERIANKVYTCLKWLHS